MLPGWALLPLRSFLGVTFVYAGLQKLADPTFLDAAAPQSIQAQLHAAATRSPIGGILGTGTHQPVLLGLLIAFSELAIGTATLLGLGSRVAAGGGAVLSAGFLLAVSWHSRPYYYGADIVFLAAWTPLILAGDGPWSIDGWLRGRVRIEHGLPAAQDVALPFETVQRLCGHYEAGGCGAQNGRSCQPVGCPVIGYRSTPPAEVIDLQRRTVLAQARLVGLVAVPVIMAGGATALLGRLLGGTHHSQTAQPDLGSRAAPPTSASAPANPPGAPPTSSTTAPAAPAGRLIGPVSAVPVGMAARFNDSGTGGPAYVVHAGDGTYRAFSAVCTHQGCTVRYRPTSNSFTCPCHGAEFDATTGAVLQGPASEPLAAIPVTVRSSQIYRTTA